MPCGEIVCLKCAPGQRLIDCFSLPRTAVLRTYPLMRSQRTAHCIAKSCILAVRFFVFWQHGQPFQCDLGTARLSHTSSMLLVQTLQQYSAHAFAYALLYLVLNDGDLELADSRSVPAHMNQAGERKPLPTARRLPRRIDSRHSSTLSIPSPWFCNGMGSLGCEPRAGPPAHSPLHRTLLGPCYISTKKGQAGRSADVSVIFG